jgi:aryl-phospho-beta-D-glucosidase BglC (GH1 family)
MKYPKILYPLGFFALALSGLSQSTLISTPTMIGVNLSGGDFGTSSSQIPGVLGQDYFYPSVGHWDWAKGRGLELVRVPFRWERVHRDTGGVLDATLWAPDMAALDASLNLAEARGMRVVLDMHNYAGRRLNVGGTSASFKIGTPELPISEFARTWKLLATHFKDRKSIWGYDIMNEPNGLAGGVATWKPMAQAAIDAIREVDTDHAIVIEGYFYAQASSWATNGAPLIDLVDPANNLVFSAHMYPDRGADGLWNNGESVQAELVNNGSYPSVEAAWQVGADRIKPFVDWCVANNVRGLVGEYGSTRTSDATNWAIVLENQLDYMVNNGAGLISGTQWGGGAWNSTYTIGMGARKDNSNAPFMPMVETYASGPGSSYWYGFQIYDESVKTTADYTFSYVFPITTPATITLSTGDTSTFYTGSKSMALKYTVPTGTSAGAGIHVRGPLTAGGVGGIDLQMSLAAGHVLSFYAKGTPGADPKITFGSTLNGSGVDGGSDTGTGNWVSLSSVQPLTSSWQHYEIPLSAFVNAQVTGALPVQRLRFNAFPADNSSYEVYFDKITLAVPSTNTPPSVTVDTSTSGSTFSVGQTVNLVATASDANAGDYIEYVEFYANNQKIGIDGTTPYQLATSFATAGAYDIRAIAVDRHGISSRSAAKDLTISSGSTTVSFTSISTEDGWIVESGPTTNVGGTFATGKVRTGDDNDNSQFVGILSFDTSAIPDGAVITSATLQIRRESKTNGNPFTIIGPCSVAVSTTAFSGNTALQATDFQAAATASNVATLSTPTSNGAYATGTLNASGANAINKTGKTQFRLSHTPGDNGNNLREFLTYKPGNDADPVKRPTLTITYQ